MDWKVSWRSIFKFIITPLLLLSRILKINTSSPYQAGLPAAMGGASYKYFRHWSWYSFHFCITPERDPSELWKRNHEHQPLQGFKLCIFHADRAGECENDYHKPEHHCLSIKGTRCCYGFAWLQPKKSLPICTTRNWKDPQTTIPCPHWNPNWASLALLSMPQLYDLLPHEKTGTAASPFRRGFLSNSSNFCYPINEIKLIHCIQWIFPQAFFQNVDESFSSSAFLPRTTAFPRIQHTFPKTTERAGTSFYFAQFERLWVPPSATPSTEGAGEKHVQTLSEQRED